MDNFSFEQYNFSELATRFGYIKMRVGNDDQRMIDIILDIFLIIQRNTQYWDSRCQFTKKKYAKHFLNSVTHLDAENFRPAFHGVVLSVYAFYQECKYWSDDHIFSVTELGFELGKLVAATNSLDTYNKLIADFDIIDKEVCRETIRDKVNNELFQKIYDEVIDRENIVQKISALSSYVDSKTLLISKLDEKIDGLETRYNFVGLHDGFKIIHDEKSEEHKKIEKIVYSISALLLIVPIVFIVLTFLSEYFSRLTVVPNQDYLWKAFSLSTVSFMSKIAIPLFSIEFILLYFFRLKYSELKNVAAQILQIKQRMTLCQFIQKYSDYSKDVQKESPGLLAKFESVIFSPIVVNESDIPPTLDGVNQLAEMISRFKK